MPLRAATTSSTWLTGSTQQQKKGINFAGDKSSQSNIQSIIIGILRKWRRSEPKQKNGEPQHGSRAKIVIEEQKLNGSWLTANKVKMKWKNMSSQDRNRINTGLPLLRPSNEQPQPATPTPRPAGRPVGTTDQAKRNIVENNVRMKNKITDLYYETRQLPVEHRPKLVDIIKEQQAVFGSDLLVAVNTIYSRIERKRPHVTQTGQVSPAIELDQRLIQIIHEYYEMNLELSRTEIINFANSHLHGSKVEQQVITWKLVHCPPYKVTKGLCSQSQKRACVAS